MLRKEPVEKGTLDLIKRLIIDRRLDKFDLVGGTALSLRIDHRKAGIMKWVFETLAAGSYNSEQNYKLARAKGIKVAKSNFWMNIRSPLYCGKIFIPKYKDEEAHFVTGQHEPLISETLFYQVQDMLDGRKRFYRPKIVANAILPLRGHLIYPCCQKILTGSKSKGRNQDYFYYHCVGGYKTLEKNYNDGDIAKKREITGSIYPEKMTFDGFAFRTARLNEAVSLIYSLGAGFSQQKNRTRRKKSALSCLVTLSGFKPETF